MMRIVLGRMGRFASCDLRLSGCWIIVGRLFCSGVSLAVSQRDIFVVIHCVQATIGRPTGGIL